jgi:hypothetical protein
MFVSQTNVLFFGEIHVVLLSMKNTCVEQRDLICALKNFSYTEYSFLKLTVFTLGNNVIDAPASDSNGFL